MSWVSAEMYNKVQEENQELKEVLVGLVACIRNSADGINVAEESIMHRACQSIRSTIQYQEAERVLGVFSIPLR